jgi:hypothetical protein
MIDIRSIRVRDTPVGALVDCRRTTGSQGFGPSSVDDVLGGHRLLFRFEGVAPSRLSVELCASSRCSRHRCSVAP